MASRPGRARAHAARARSATFRFSDPSSNSSRPPEAAGDYLIRWYRGAIRSRLEPIKNFAYTIRDHWDGVLRWHERKATIALLEGTNSLVQAAKRRARGYRSKGNLIAMTYLIAGKLDLALTHTI